MRETISVTVEGRAFVFYQQPNIIEEREITNQMVTLLGGWENYSKFDAAIKNAYQKHLEFVKNKLGDAYSEKHAELQKMQDEEKFTEKYFNLFKELNGNYYYKQFASLVSEKAKVSDYAYLIVMCKDKPEDFEFHQSTSSELDAIINEIAKKYGKFREEKKK